MFKLTIPALAFGLIMNAHAGDCPKPKINAAKAFSIIEGSIEVSLNEFLKTNVVLKTELNEKCEDLYLASIRSRNDNIRKYLESIGYGPNNKSEVNKSFAKLDANYYEYSLMFGNLTI